MVHVDVNAGWRSRARWIPLGLAFAACLAIVFLAAPFAADAAPAHAAAQLATDTTVAPEPTEPAEPGGPEDGTEEDTGLSTTGVVLIVLVVVVVLLIFLAGRGSARSSSVTVTSVPPPPPPAPASSRVPALRRVYSNGRTILDRLDDRAIARRSESGRHTADETKSIIESTLADIYGLEADAPTTTERSLLRETAESINALDRAVESAATAAVSTDLEPARTRLAHVLDRLADHISASS